MATKKTDKRKIVEKNTVRKKLSIAYTFKLITTIINANGLQDPDTVVIVKQWNELGVFKGYWADLTYLHPRKNNLVISLDVTPFYVRTIGNIDKAPLFTPGTHNFPKD